MLHQTDSAYSTFLRVPFESKLAVQGRALRRCWRVGMGKGCNCRCASSSAQFPVIDPPSKREQSRHNQLVTKNDTVS